MKPIDYFSDLMSKNYEAVGFIPKPRLEKYIEAHTQRQSEEWPTPHSLFDPLDAEFHFTLDPCATTENAKCARFFTRDDDGLSKRWDGIVFVNPPFRYCGDWIRKAWEESQRGATVVCLVPSRTDTDWWHRYAVKAEIRWIRGRVKYNTKTNAPFASCILIFRALVGSDIHSKETP